MQCAHCAFKFTSIYFLTIKWIEMSTLSQMRILFSCWKYSGSARFIKLNCELFFFGEILFWMQHIHQFFDMIVHFKSRITDISIKIGIQRETFFYPICLEICSISVCASVCLVCAIVSDVVIRLSPWLVTKQSANQYLCIRDTNFTKKQK